MSGPLSALRGPMIGFVDNPCVVGPSALTHDSDGLLVMQDGHVIARGHAPELLAQWQDKVSPVHHPHGLIVPGFVDTHLHMPQVGVMGAYGRQLLDWLNDYTFPNEARFADPEVCVTEARVFVDALLSHGVTTGSVFCTIHPASVEALFTEAATHDMRMVAGKVMMDRNAPDNLRDTAQTGFDDSLALLRRWHGKGRARYSVTPRFAPTSTEAQLEAAQVLVASAPGVHVQSHVSENLDEIEWVRSLYPQDDHYMGVYARFGLVGRRAIHGHGIHLTDAEWALIQDTDTALAHCPTSNFFLGSGLFDLRRSIAQEVRVGLASDIGGGTSLSPLRTMGAAYKVAQLRGHSVSAAELWWLHTVGAARALDMDDVVGGLEVGQEADAVVLDWSTVPLWSHRLARAKDIHELLFFLAACGDERAVAETWVAGKRVFRRPTPDSAPAA